MGTRRFSTRRSAITMTSRRWCATIAAVSLTAGVSIAMIAPSTPTADATSGGSPYDSPSVIDDNPDPTVLETTIIADEVTVDIGGGVMANVQAFNGTVPGPTFHLSVGERVIVHFENHMAEPTGIHWHGIELQNQMDGTPLTQDQVPSGDSYTYDFVVSRPGVFWYHPHHEFSSNQVFRGMYGAIIVDDPNQAALVSAGTLPAAADTRVMVLSDTTVCKAPSTNDMTTYDLTLPWAGGSPLVAQQGRSPFELCENAPIDSSGAPLPSGVTYLAGDIPAFQQAGTSGFHGEGQTVLTNGVNVGGRAGDPAAPGALDSGASVLSVQPGQGVRLQLVNAAPTRFFRLRLTLSDGTQVPLVRVGGEAGLLDAALVDGGTYGLDKWASGELLLDPGDRDDVVAVFPPSASGVATLWTLDISRTGAGFSKIPTVPVAHFKVQGPVASPAYTIADGTPLRSFTGDLVEVLPAPTDTLINPATLSPPKAGNPNSDIKLTGTGTSLGIDGVIGSHDYTMYYAEHPPPASARYAAVGDLLELSVTNTTGAHHPYHLHGFSIQPRSLSGCTGPVTGFTYPRTEFMDNLDIPPGCTLTFRIRLDDRMLTDHVTPGGALGRWMFHCHIFFHHQFGMVSELVVTDANGNERPYLDVLQTAISADEGASVSNSGPLLDPEDDAVILTASIGTVVDNADGTWGWTGVAPDGPSSQNVYITATDSNGNRGQVAFRLDSVNLAPTVTLDGGQVTSIDEGDTLTVAATFVDPGVDDPYTATVDFGTGDGPQPATVSLTSVSQPQTGSISASRQYGDNGTFPVTVTVTDDDGDSGSVAFVVTVANVDPDVTIETPSPVIAQVNDTVAFDGRITDPGSDDLTSTWAFDDGSPPWWQVSFVNPPTPDPLPSPSNQPRNVEHDATHVYSQACAYEPTLDATDDDGGTDTDSIIVVITNEPSAIRGAGYWQHQYKGNGNIRFSTAQLLCYLDIARVMSVVFDEVRPATTIAEGYAVLYTPPRTPITNQLDRMLLAAWLNFANGGIALSDGVDSNGDHVIDTTFGALMAAAEAARINTTTNPSVLEAYKNAVERVIS